MPFLKNDAPTEVALIIEDLQLVKAILDEIRNAKSSSSPPSSSSSTLPPVVLTTIQQCNKQLVEFTALLNRFDLSATSRTRLKWNAIKVVLRKDEIERFRRSIEAAKISLLSACQLTAE
ncbi:MAG: hypothetical protein M1812_007220 [Candelaria pacifica]|nr:MAG: hypothetical protein M1812_007220 [Candelaria pacifica]